MLFTLYKAGLKSEDLGTSVPGGAPAPRRGQRHSGPAGRASFLSRPRRSCSWTASRKRPVPVSPGPGRRQAGCVFSHAPQSSGPLAWAPALATPSSLLCFWFPVQWPGNLKRGAWAPGLTWVHGGSQEPSCSRRTHPPAPWLGDSAELRNHK